MTDVDIDALLSEQRVYRYPPLASVDFTAELPKTRSGKIMRRLRDAAEHRSSATPPRSPTRTWSTRSAAAPPQRQPATDEVPPCGLAGDR
jgi:hypothetical protein